MKKRTIRQIGFLIVYAWIALGFGENTHAQAGQDHSSSPLPLITLSPSATVTVEFGGPVGFAYRPSNIFILPGDEVHWLGSFAEHPLVSDEGLWMQVDSGTAFTYTFNQPGVYRFHCAFHSSFGMSGTVTVGYRVMLPLLQR